MNYQITSDNIDLSPSMETLAKEKFSKVERHLKYVPESEKLARIVLNKAEGAVEKFHVKIHLTVGGLDFFSDENDFTLAAALVKTVEEIDRMIRKEKNKEEKTKEITWKKIREYKRG